MTTAAQHGFAALGLTDAILKTLERVGYEVPTPIQARTIPPLLEGRDVLGQAQTGTGKTAAFALPLLSRIDTGRRSPQVLVLTPTRELAIQVAEAFQSYAAGLDDLHVLPIYGGQSYGIQLKRLERGVQVVVGTPGRVMDHLRRGTLDLQALQALVLDEADEMLRMGFIDDVEWILEHTPPERQMALFSATLPAEVRRIAHRHLRTPVEVRLEERATSAASVRQRVWIVAGTSKLDALTRILEVEPFAAMIVFVRTRNATSDLAERLCARGFDAAAIHGDIPQGQRERLIANLRSGALDILVATDVAARGLDVERVSHVVNFDVPYDTEAYVHRIGRTGRAGRSGEAILFVAQRERHMLRTIERTTGHRIEPMDLPSRETINNVRVARFFDGLSRTLAEADLTDLTELMARYQREHDVDPLRMAAALAHQGQHGQSLSREAPAPPKRQPQPASPAPPDDAAAERPRPERPRPERPAKPSRSGREQAERPHRAASGRHADEPAPRRQRRSDEAVEVELFRVEVGRDHGAEPRHIVGAIANEAGVDPRYIGRIEIGDEHSTVELPVGMPKPVFDHLRTVWVAGRRLNISRVRERAGGPGAQPKGRGRAGARPSARKGG
jgi:ATP-dependent RNA helicase DeaD